MPGCGGANGRLVSRGRFRVGGYGAFQPEFMDGRQYHSRANMRRSPWSRRRAAPITRAICCAYANWSASIASAVRRGLGLFANHLPAAPGELPGSHRLAKVSLRGTEEFQRAVAANSCYA